MNDKYRVLALLMMWLLLSIAMILLNKHLLYYRDFPYPIFLALWHMVAAATTSNVVLAVKHDHSILWHCQAKGMQVAIVGILYAASLVLGMGAFLYLTVSTIQMLKLVGPATSFAVGLAFGVEKYSHAYFLKILVVCAGVAVASCGDITFSFIGYLLQLLSILVDAVRCTVLQRVLQNDVSSGPLQVLAHVSPVAALALWLPFSWLELPRMEYRAEQIWSVLPLLAASGVLACCLNFVAFAFIGATSALTAQVSSISKDVLIIAIGAYTFHNVITSQQILGYGVALVGMFWYQYGKAKGPSTLVKA